MKEIDKKLFEGVRWKRNIPRRVTCNECQYEWCFFCHAPWHDKITCKEYQQGEKMLRSWAAQMDQNQHNAQKCPRCKVCFITLIVFQEKKDLHLFRYIYLEMVVVLIWFVRNVNVIFVIIVDEED